MRTFWSAPADAAVVGCAAALVGWGTDVAGWGAEVAAGGGAGVGAGAGAQAASPNRAAIRSSPSRNERLDDRIDFSSFQISSACLPVQVSRGGNPFAFAGSVIISRRYEPRGKERRREACS